MSFDAEQYRQEWLARFYMGANNAWTYVPRSKGGRFSPLSGGGKGGGGGGPSQEDKDKKPEETKKAAPETSAREVSDRRIRSLRSNGEHERNTSAWRDAVHERQLLDHQDKGKAKSDDTGKLDSAGAERVRSTARKSIAAKAKTAAHEATEKASTAQTKEAHEAAAEAHYAAAKAHKVAGNDVEAKAHNNTAHEHTELAGKAGKAADARAQLGKAQSEQLASMEAGAKKHEASGNHALAADRHDELAKTKKRWGLDEEAKQHESKAAELRAGKNDAGKKSAAETSAEAVARVRKEAKDTDDPQEAKQLDKTASALEKAQAHEDNVRKQLDDAKAAYRAKYGQGSVVSQFGDKPKGLTGKTETPQKPEKSKAQAKRDFQAFKSADSGRAWNEAMKPAAMTGKTPEIKKPPVNTAAKPKTKTYAEAKEGLQSHLASEGWKVQAGLKVPHATSPDGKTRLWFKGQAVHFTHSESGKHDAKEARTVTYDTNSLKSMKPADYVKQHVGNLGPRANSLKEGAAGASAARIGGPKSPATPSAPPPREAHHIEKDIEETFRHLRSAQHNVDRGATKGIRDSARLTVEKSHARSAALWDELRRHDAKHGKKTA